MSQKGQRQTRGENTRPAPPSRTENDSARSQSTTQSTPKSALPSIEPTDASSKTSASATQSPAQANVFRVPQSPRSHRGEPDSKAAKIAIPRLKRNIDAANEGSTRTGGRHRVNHACEPCRHRKTKCSGERLTCRHCQDFKISCYYADGKRDRVKKYARDPSSKKSRLTCMQAIRKHDREGGRLRKVTERPLPEGD